MLKKYLLASVLLSIAGLGCSGNGEGRGMAPFSPNEVCIAAIAANNNRPVRGITVTSTQAEIIQVGYVRDDGRRFSYSCRIDGEEVRWKDGTMSDWARSIRLYYSVQPGDKLDIKIEITGGEGRDIAGSYTKKDFK